MAWLVPSLVAPVAEAEELSTNEAVELQTPATCKTDGGSEVRLPAGVHLSKATFERIEAEYIAKEKEVIRLKAENKVLKNYEDPLSTTVAVSVLAAGVGILAGHYLWR